VTHNKCQPSPHSSPFITDHNEEERKREDKREGIKERGSKRRGGRGRRDEGREKWKIKYLAHHSPTT
jgi:hypothetical protein